MADPTDPAGRRTNGLQAADWGALVDLDPRLSEGLLDRLEAAGVAAYVEPATAVDTVSRAVTMPPRPLDRLWVDPARADSARAVVASEVADLTALLAEDDPGATAYGLVHPVPRAAARRVLLPPALPGPSRPQPVERRAESADSSKAAGERAPAEPVAADQAGLDPVASDPVAVDRSSLDAAALDAAALDAAALDAAALRPAAADPAAADQAALERPLDRADRADREAADGSGQGPAQRGGASRPLSDDEVFADLVARFHEADAPRPGGRGAGSRAVPWPQAEDLPAQPPQARRRRTDPDAPTDAPVPDPGPRRQPPSAAPRASGAAPSRPSAARAGGDDLDLPAWLEPEALEDDGHYVPPPPPPVPRIRARTLGACICIVLGLLVLFAPGLLHLTATSGVSVLGLALLAGGAGALVWWMRDSSDDGPGDGAVV